MFRRTVCDPERFKKEATQLPDMGANSLVPTAGASAS